MGRRDPLTRRQTLAVRSRTARRTDPAVARWRRPLPLLLFAALAPTLVAADEPDGATALPTVSVVGATPLPGLDLPKDRVPAPVQTATGAEISRSGALSLGDFMNRRLGSVHVNEIQGNPFQPDVSFRGYTASPLLGTPQGLSIYV